MTANRLYQVLRTYTTRLVFWLIVAIWLGTLLVLPAGAKHGLSFPDLVDLVAHRLFPSLMLAAGLGMIVGTMLKAQFADPRARLLPRFAGTHLAVAATIVVVATVVDAGMLAWAGRVSWLAAASLYLAVIMAGAWSGCWVSQVFIWFVFALIYGTMLAPRYVAGLIQSLSDRPTLSLACVGLGLAALVILGRRLWMLSEEMPQYSRQMPSSVWRFTSRGAARDRQRWESQVIARSRVQGPLRDVLVRLVFRWLPAPGLTRRMLLRQLAGGFSSLFWAPFLFGMIVLIFGMQTPPTRPIGAGAVYFMILFMISFIPFQFALCMPGGWWVRRWPYLARESLFPLGRTTFIRDLALAMALDVAAAAVVHCAAIVTCFALFHPLSSMVELLPAWIVLTLVQYTVAYWLLFWLVSYRSHWALMAGILVAAPISAGLLIAALYAGQQLGPLAVLGPVLLLTVLGAGLLYRLTMRRWCRVELG
ncbi:MAG: hypothetical protein JW888_08685 [Pirellulales bacterium]|nr:hypothetical protein [Pirellulales bacterium]